MFSFAFLEFSLSKNCVLGKKKMNMMTMEGMMNKGVLDDIIRRLLDSKGAK